MIALFGNITYAANLEVGGNPPRLLASQATVGRLAEHDSAAPSLGGIRNQLPHSCLGIEFVRHVERFGVVMVF